MKENGIEAENIIVKYVPGTFELPLAYEFLIEADEEIDGVIAIGCVIQGEKKHFYFVYQRATQGIIASQMEHSTPISFCVLTDNTGQQFTIQAANRPTKVLIVPWLTLK